MPRVSIMMNVYNGAAYVREALDSVLAQTFVDWEIVFWDNESTDATPRIAADFGDSRLRYFRSSGETLPALARQLAIAQARGEWLAFLDHDDTWLPTKLALQIAVANDDPDVAIIYGRSVSIGAHEREADFDHRREFGPLLQGDIFEHLFTESCFIQMSSAMLRRSAVMQVGGIADWIGIVSDYYLYLELSHRHRTRAVQSVVNRYRLRPNSLTHTAEWQMHVEVVKLIERWAGFVDPTLVAIRRRNQATRLAVAEMRRPGSLWTGIAKLLSEGSAWFLTSRPPVWLYREVRRLVRRPIWKQDRSEPVWRGAPASVAGWPLTLSVIVVNRKGRDLLRGCLQSLYGRTRLAVQDWEVIVVDDDSGDGSAGMVRAEFPRARLVASNASVALASNHGYGFCRGRHVFLLDSGSLVQDGAVDRLLEIMAEHPGVGALGCQLVDADGTFQRSSGNFPRLSNVAGHFLLPHRLFPDGLLSKPLYVEREPSGEVEVGWVAGTAMLVRREALGAMLFDQRFADQGEDFELCDRLRLGDWKVMYTPAARIVVREVEGPLRQTVEVQPRRLRGLRTAFALHTSAAFLPAYDFIVRLGLPLRGGPYDRDVMERGGKESHATAATRYRDTKFLIVRGLRATGLLRLADSCKFALGKAKSWRANRRFREHHPDFATPPRHLAFDALNHVDWERYRSTGLQHARLCARIIRAHVPAGKSLEILEWGCGPGRLIRHMADLLPEIPVSLTGTDANVESVAWCRQNLSGIRFVENGLNPPLPFADSQFDAIYCFSVVTHLSEAVQLAWAKELMRVLKPGGLWVCTTHGNAYRYLLAGEDERTAFDAGRVVVQGKYQEGKKWFIAIHPHAFVRDRLLAGWTDVRRVPTLPEEGILQDVWVARKPPAKSRVERFAAAGITPG